MAISKPRKMTVDDVLYHWKVSTHGKLHLVVINPEEHNQKLVINFLQGKKVIKPWNVKAYINQALKQGWKKDITLNWERDE